MKSRSFGRFAAQDDRMEGPRMQVRREIPRHAEFTRNRAARDDNSMTVDKVTARLGMTAMA